MRSSLNCSQYKIEWNAQSMKLYVVLRMQKYNASSLIFTLFLEYLPAFVILFVSC